MVILGALLAFERRGRPFAGRTFWTYLLLYPAVRFVIEFYRGDPRGSVFDLLSTSQFVSALLIPLSIVMLILLARLGRIDGAAGPGARRHLTASGREPRDMAHPGQRRAATVRTHRPRRAGR